MRYHFTPVRMAVTPVRFIDLSSINQQAHMLVRMWRKGNTFGLLVEIQTGAATWKFPQKLKVELPYD